MPQPLLKLRQRALAALESRADRQELYDDHYYEHTVDPIMVKSAGTMAGSITRELDPPRSSTWGAEAAA